MARHQHPETTADLDAEFGVPFPGTVVPAAQWTQTAWKALPTQPIQWPERFGNANPVVLDVGCGNGRSTIGLALENPSQNYVGIDPLPVVIRYAVRRANQRGLTNVRFAVAEGRDFFERLVPPASLAEVHIYHPQPYYDMAYVHCRLITPEFIALVHSRLVSGGRLVVQTDNPGYWHYIATLVPLFFDFSEHPDPWPTAPAGRTRREILARRQGLTIHRGVGTAKVGLDPADLRQRGEQLPLPLFSADRRLRALDRLE